MSLMGRSVNISVVKEYWSQNRPLGGTTYEKPPFGQKAIDYNPLAAAFQPLPYPPNSAVFEPVILQFSDNVVLQNHVEGLTDVKVGNTGCSSFVGQRCYSIIQGHQICQE